MEHCTFRPQINPSSIGEADFFQRLEKNNQARALKEYEAQVKKAANLIDEKSGKPLFQPTVGRPPKTQRKGIKKSYMDPLEKSQRDSSMNDLSQQNNSNEKSKSWWEESTSKPMINTTSEAYYEVKMKKEFQEIFLLMDSDRDGEISAEKIEIRTLHPEILKVISPLLAKMEENNSVLTMEDFSNEVWTLLKKLTPYDRDKIMKHQKTREKNKEPEHKVTNRVNEAIFQSF